MMAHFLYHLYGFNRLNELNRQLTLYMYVKILLMKFILLSKMVYHYKSLSAKMRSDDCTDWLQIRKGDLRVYGHKSHYYFRSWCYKFYGITENYKKLES